MSNLENMTEEELAALAQERRIPGRAKMTRDELVQALRATDTEAAKEQTVVLRAEDERWLEVREEMAQLRADVERARLEREREEEEVRLEHEQAWLERRERVERARAREEAVVRRARQRARELREREEIAREYAADVPAAERGSYRDLRERDDWMLESAGMVGRMGREASRLVCTTANAASNAVVTFAETMMPPSEAPRRRRRRGGRSTGVSGVCGGMTDMAMSTARRTVDATMDAPRSALDTFYEEYGTG